MDEEPDEMVCLHCEEKIENDEYYGCDCCLKKIHKACSALGGSEVKCMPLQRRVLMLICGNCRVYLARMPYMIKIMEEMRSEIQDLKKSIGNIQRVESYSQKLKGTGPIENKQNNISAPTLIIKPKTPQSYDQTKKDLQQRVDPVKLKVGIKNLKGTKNGNAVVKCTSKQEIELLKKEAENRLKDRYVVEAPKLKLPRAKIVGYTGSKSADELKESLIQQNSWIQQSKDEFRVAYVGRKNSKRQSTVFVECSPALFSRMMKVNKVCIDWERLPVYEDLNITRCYNCQGYRHKGSSCSNKKVCGNCAGEHDTLVCQSRTRACGNCIAANGRYNTQYDTGHAAVDKNCPSTRYHLEILKSRIDYGV